MKSFDVIIVTGEEHEDHPLSPSGVLKRVLEAKGYTVGIIEKPQTKEDYAQLGLPKLFFAVTSGSIDSMLNNYTPLKKERLADEYSHTKPMPDRAVIVYCNKLRESFPGCKLVIGGVEASLRRFTHYDYWDNHLRRSILLDSRADILIYGNGEKQIIEIADRLKQNQDLLGIAGTCIISKELPKDFVELPSHEEVVNSKEQFCRAQIKFSNYINLAQKYPHQYVLQSAYPNYTTTDLDWIYSLPYTRDLRPGSLLKMAQFTVVTHRGCFGKCNFCSIALHQGDRIISRSEQSILEEIKRITKHPQFKGTLDDLGGPSANMYGMDCALNCGKDCIPCKKTAHQRLIQLLRKARAIKGVKKIFVRSGIRYDLALKEPEYVRELCQHHISGSLKIAPEHFAPEVLQLMNKSGGQFDKFISLFNSFNPDGKQSLKYYFMICHPGESKETLQLLISKAKKLKNIEQYQIFTPTPMSISSCMYWTGLNPFTLKSIKVIYDYNTKKQMKREFLRAIGESRDRD